MYFKFLIKFLDFTFQRMLENPIRNVLPRVKSLLHLKKNFYSINAF